MRTMILTVAFLVMACAENKDAKTYDELNKELKMNVKQKAYCQSDLDCTAEYRGCHSWIPYNKNETIEDELHQFDERVSSILETTPLICTTVCDSSYLTCKNNFCEIVIPPQDELNIHDTISSGCDNLYIFES